MDELLAKCVVEPWIGGVVFYSIYLWFLSTLAVYDLYSFKHKQINCFMHIPSFKMHTIRQVWYLIQQDDNAFSVDLKDAYLHICIVKYHYNFLWFVWHHIFSLEGFAIGLPTAPRVSLHLLNPYYSFADARVFMLEYMWMISWSCLPQSMLARGHKSFCVLSIG